MTTIGFTGAGAMGAPMVRNLLGAGHDVLLWGRTPAKLEGLVAAGARLADSPEAVASESDVVLGCLTDGPAIREIYLGRMLGVARPGQVFADHGTYAPQVAEEVAAAFAERGAIFLDAPVSGGPPGAEAGTLVCAVGGDAAGVEVLRPIAAAYTKKVAHMGAPGRGLMLKLINNYHVSINLTAAAETALLIERLGLDQAESMEVLFGGLADSACLRVELPKALAHEYGDANGFIIGGLVEVQRNIAELLASADFESGLFPFARELFKVAAVDDYDSRPAALTKYLPRTDG